MYFILIGPNSIPISVGGVIIIIHEAIRTSSNQMPIVCKPGHTKSGHYTMIQDSFTHVAIVCKLARGCPYLISA